MPRVVRENRRQSLSAEDLKINILPCQAFDVSDSEALALRVSVRVRHTEVFNESLLIILIHLDGL